MTLFKKMIVMFLWLNLLGGSAAANIMVDNGKVSYVVKPGETISDSLTVYNTSSDKAVTLKVYWEDFEYIAPFQGEKKFHPAGTRPDSCRQWVVFSPSELTIAPLSDQKVNYTIKIPDDVTGGHYGVLFFESRAESNARIGIALATRLGSLFFIEAENRNKTGVIKDIQINENEFQAVFENSGDVLLSAEGVFYIMDSKGLVVDRGKISTKYLPTNTQTELTWLISEKVKPADYTLILTMDLGDGNSLVKEIDFKKNMDQVLELKQIRE